MAPFCVLHATNLPLEFLQHHLTMNKERRGEALTSKDGQTLNVASSACAAHCVPTSANALHRLVCRWLQLQILTAVDLCIAG